MTGNRGLKRILLAAGYSVKGLWVAFSHEVTFRQELFLISYIWLSILWKLSGRP